MLLKWTEKKLNIVNKNSALFDSWLTPVIYPDDLDHDLNLIMNW